MLEDRPYMRQPAFKPRLSATVILVLINVAAFVLQNILEHYWSGLYPCCALSAEGLREGYVWQLLTFQLMHSGFWHLFWNCFAIWMFGRSVEDALGSRRFVILYFGSGIVGGLFQAIAGLIAPLTFGGIVVGASAGAFGITSAFAILFPDSVLLLFFIIPMRARYLLALSAALAIGGMVFPQSDFFGPHVAHAAHLGGMLAGFLFVRYAAHWNFNVPPWPTRRSARPPRRLVKVTSQKGGGWRKSASAQDLSPDEFLSKEVDPILDKISAQGIQSLTDRERRILEAARAKMKK